jgi:glc operon protein GlcG
MKSRLTLTAADAAKMGAAAVAEAQKNQWNVSITVVDDGGHMLWFTRLDGAPPASSYISYNKARTAALGRRETKVYEDMINGGRVSFLSAPELQAMLEGGVPINAGGDVVGAIGVSGVKSTEDAQIGNAGIAALTQ